jgi:hypothetical protein
MKISTSELQGIMRVDSLERVDVELDDLHSMGMFSSDGPGFVLHDVGSNALIKLSSMALNFYSRCNGFIDPKEIFLKQL